jgi:hypothetical protein
MSKLEELRALKKLNMKRIVKLRDDGSKEIKLAEKLDKFLTQEIINKGGVAVIEKNLSRVEFKQSKCDVLFGNYAGFTSDKKRKAEIEQKNQTEREDKIVEPKEREIEDQPVEVYGL